MVTLALPSGNLLEAGLDLLSRSGVAQLDRAQLGRRLKLEIGAIRVVIVRPADVAAYVDHGAADLGMVGKDQLWEAQGTHYELADLRFGACTLVLAVPAASALNGPGSWPPMIRVATKYPVATGAFMAGIGQAVDLVHLHGSVELAPQVGLADAIADLTASGRTLAENHLRVVAEIAGSTARLIANQASLKTRTDEIQAVVTRLRAAVA